MREIHLTEDLVQSFVTENDNEKQLSTWKYAMWNIVIFLHRILYQYHRTLSLYSSDVKVYPKIVPS